MSWVPRPGPARPVNPATSFQVSSRPAAPLWRLDATRREPTGTGSRRPPRPAPPHVVVHARPVPLNLAEREKGASA